MDTPIATGCSGTSPSVNVLSPVADNPATHQLPPVAESAEELLFELQRSADQRFRWITLFLEDFREWTSRRQVWDEKVKATLRQYCEAGWPEAADELSAALLSKPYVTRPGTFKLQWHTGYGQERVTIFFEGSESDDDEKSRRLSRSGSDLSQSVDPDSESDRASSAPQLTVEPPSKDRSCNQCQAAHQRCDRSRPVCSRCSRLCTDCSYHSRPHSTVQKEGQRVNRPRHSRTPNEATTTRINVDYQALTPTELRNICRERGISLDAVPRRGAKRWMQGALVGNDAQRQPTVQAHTRLQYMAMPIGKLKEMCTARGLTLDTMPQKGANAWLAWKLIADDTSQGHKPGRTVLPSAYYGFL